MENQFAVTIEGDVAKVHLVGRLDATNAPALQDKMMTLKDQAIRKVVFFAQDLAYIASSGLRVIIFAKQKMGAETQVYLIGAREMVLDVIKMTGLNNFMIIQDTYDEK
ncbi:anti-sigma factor antagonist [bacterium]|nr:anti-sigma factor antagonist [bacterium]